MLFTPATRASGCSRGKAATLPHEILVHELVHALRRVSGHLHPHKVINRLQPYTHTEEFLAILVTNIFISDTVIWYRKSPAPAPGATRWSSPDAPAWLTVAVACFSPNFVETPSTTALQLYEPSRCP